MVYILNVNTVDRIAYADRSTLRARQGISGKSSFDFELTNPPVDPELGETAELKDGAEVLWTGTITAIETKGILAGQRTHRVTASNETQPAFTAAPWGLSDSPNGSTTRAYGSLSIQETQEEGEGETKTRIGLTTWSSGLEAGMTIALTNSAHGYSATEFTISEIDRGFDPVEYKLNLGDVRVPLSAWVEGEIDSEFPIDGTKITDGAITTPKLAANSVTTPILAANAVTADKLAASLILASLIQAPAATGRRVEIDGAGIRLLDSDESLLVNIPTSGDPVYVRGEVIAASLVSESAAELRGTTSLPIGAVMTAQNAVGDPPTAPSVVASLDSLTLTSSPATPGHGIYRDAAAGTYWLGADPTAGTSVAHEYNATTGALVRSIPKTGSTNTYTSTLGATSHISDSAQASQGTGDSQVAGALTFPSDGYPKRATHVGAWFAGYTGAQSAKVAIWSSAYVLLAKSAAFTATERPFANGNSDLYYAQLTSPLSVSDGQFVRPGFLRTTATPGFQWDRDDGVSGTSLGSGLDGNMTSVTTDNSRKPNVYITYEYDVDTAVEKAKIVGVASDSVSGVVACLGADGILHRYNRSDLSYLSATDLSAQIGGTKANAGLTFDGTYFVITTATGTTGTDQVRLVRVTTAGVYSSTLNTTGFAINGSTATIRGGYYDGGNDNIWVVVNSQVRRYDATGAYVPNHEFGSAASTQDGLTFDGSVFRGWAVSAPTRIWKFTNWTWTTESALYWVGYSWYDSVATTHETRVSPRTSITMQRRQRVQISTPSIPIGGADEPDRCRVYMERNASQPAAGSYKLQVTDALTSRYLTTFASGGAADPTSNNFAAGTPAEIRSGVAVGGSGGWSLKGDGTVVMAFVGVKAYHGATQIIPDSTVTAVLLNSEEYDSNAIHDNVTNSSRFTVPAGKAGKWRCGFHVMWDANATGVRVVQVNRNGAQVRGSRRSMVASSATTHGQGTAIEMAMSVGDYLEFGVWQNSGADRTIGTAGDNNAVTAWAQFLGT